MTGTELTRLTYRLPRDYAIFTITEWTGLCSGVQRPSNTGSRLCPISARRHQSGADGAKVGSTTPTIDYHGQQMALPASTQKVITALAALLQLGPDFRFNTTFETRGQISAGTLNGDLIVRFDGDPTLRRQNIRNMVASLKKQGIARISGDILIDTSVFASHDKAPGWPWNDLTQCFSAPPAAAIVDRNCFSISLYSAPKAGDRAFIRVASYYPVHMFSEVKTLARGSAEAPIASWTSSQVSSTAIP